MYQDSELISVVDDSGISRYFSNLSKRYYINVYEIISNLTESVETPTHLIKITTKGLSLRGVEEPEIDERPSEYFCNNSIYLLEDTMRARRYVLEIRDFPHGKEFEMKRLRDDAPVDIRNWKHSLDPSWSDLPQIDEKYFGCGIRLWASEPEDTRIPTRVLESVEWVLPDTDTGPDGLLDEVYYEFYSVLNRK